MHDSQNTRDQSKVVPIRPLSKKPSPTVYADGKINIDASQLDRSIKGEFRGEGLFALLRRLLSAQPWAIAASLALFVISIAAHFVGLEVPAAAYDVAPGASYDELVAFHNKLARQAAHLAFLSKASFLFATTIVLYLALRISLFRVWLHA